MKELWLAVEGGGTKTRVLLADTHLNVLSKEVGGSASPLYIHRKEYARRLGTLLKRTKRVLDDAGGKISTLGVGGPMVGDLVQEKVFEFFGPLPVVGAGELEIALAVHDLDFGVTLVAGTGASARCKDEDGNVNGFGGFGPQFGDEGCGYWIGRESIAAAMRAEEGREHQTVLVPRLREHFGLPRMTHIVKSCDHSGHVPAPKVASCVPCVFQAAREGDEAALAICRNAGTALGALVVQAASRCTIRTQPMPVAVTGGVFHGGPLILDTFNEVLAESRIGFDLRPPVPEPTLGILKYIQQRKKRKGKRRVSR